MSVRFLTALAAGLAVVAGPAAAQQPARPKADPAEAVLKTLHEPVGAELPALGDGTLFEMLVTLSKRSGTTFVIVEEAFKSEGVNDIQDRKPNFVATQTKGLTAHQLLTLTLEGMSATYLVKNGRVEIVPVRYAARVAKVGTTVSEDGHSKLNETLVSAVIKEQPLNEAVAAVAERYELNVVVSPQSGDARTGFVTARLLNVPADKALELLAVQCDLRVVRKGNAFLITGRDHANEMFNEKLERERQKIEVEKLRDAPFPRPEPVPQPQPQPQPQPAPKP